VNGAREEGGVPFPTRPKRPGRGRRRRKPRERGWKTGVGDSLARPRRPGLGRLRWKPRERGWKTGEHHHGAWTARHGRRLPFPPIRLRDDPSLATHGAVSQPRSRGFAAQRLLGPAFRPGAANLPSSATRPPVSQPRSRGFAAQRLLGPALRPGPVHAHPPAWEPRSRGLSLRALAHSGNAGLIACPPEPHGRSPPRSSPETPTRPAP
jgi:hypothetical protein